MTKTYNILERGDMMNFYNPYYMSMPIASGRGISSLFGRGGFNLGNLLNGAQRTLGLINQAIPLIKQAAPMVRNAKTMFKVMNEFKKVDTPQTKINKELQSEQKNVYDSSVTDSQFNDFSSNGGPTFFV